MPIYQKADFYKAAMAQLEQYPELAGRVAAGDVTITQQIGAIAQMLAMLSYQIGLAEVEPWIKARDNMVLADAVARGVLPFGKAATYEANIVNRGTKAINITAGRRLLDNKGRVWVVKSGSAVGAGQTKAVHIEQYETLETVHEVGGYTSFYQIPITPPDNDNYLLDVSVRHSDGTHFVQVERFNNVESGDRVYHIAADEMMNVYVQFGTDIAGYIPNVGEKITLSVKYTGGNVTLQEATPLELEYLDSGEEALEIFSSTQVVAGAVPFSISELREITNYPSIYDNNAVFLGEFTFLLQRKLSPFVFLSVWNEQIEEKARGANVENINTLFVSFIKDGMQQNEAQTQIKRIIAEADNSYKIKFVTAKEQQLTVTVQLFLAPMHDETAVKQKVKLYLLNQYGRTSAWARKGRQRINWQQTVKGLRENINELQDGVSDISLSVNQPGNSLPENFSYITEQSINISSSKLLGV